MRQLGPFIVTVSASLFLISTNARGQTKMQVPGTADVQLAGQKSDATLGGDSVAQDAPAEIDGFHPGETITISATGYTCNGPAGCCGRTPNGGEGCGGVGGGPHFGVSSIDGFPINALVGVFLGAREPAPARTPSALNAAHGFTSAAPALHQVFFVGAGPRKVKVPAGASRLFLGSTDSPGGNYNNVGSFEATIFPKRSQFSVKEEGGKIGITLSDAVLFDFNKYDLKPAAAAVLTEIKSTILDKHPHSKIAVEGYTDDAGSDAYNLQLSNQRAKTVADWLQQHGLERSRLQTKGYGKAKPKVANTSESNRAKNRRVEINVIN
jgi:outer membrane protein OmpA-like peptidoglycan-associated protein